MCILLVWEMWDQMKMHGVNNIKYIHNCHISCKACLISIWFSFQKNFFAPINIFRAVLSFAQKGVSVFVKCPEFSDLKNVYMLTGCSKILRYQILGKCFHWFNSCYMWTDRHTDGQTYGRTDIRTDRHTDGQTYGRTLSSAFCYCHTNKRNNPQLTPWLPKAKQNFQQNLSFLSEVILSNN
jgi:hypothetical protein